ncbi:hypothetical protein [Candidatus Sororendozoicomonas aggregata]|uniref:hypothetical protein n=1 Tax=Candidatus Sororendozoicomonas aggregata TaxID=3073239 RepID=UPI002ED522BF
MNKSERKAGRRELTCIVESSALDLFVLIMHQHPILSNILRFLSFEDISNLREAVKHCHATSPLHGLLLYEGLLKVTPYDMEEIQYLKKIKPYLTLINNWTVFDYTNVNSGQATSLDKKFEIIRLIVYDSSSDIGEIDDHTTIVNDGVFLLENQEELRFNIPPYLYIKDDFKLAGELSDKTVFYFKFWVREHTEVNICFGGGLAIFAPTYKGLIHHLIRNGIMNDFVDGLKTSRQLSNALNRADPDDDNDLLDDALRRLR